MGLVRRLCATFASVVIVASAALANEWPSRPVLVVSPFATGTTNDIVAHMVLDPAAAQLGQSFMIENRPGGGGTLGVTAVAKAAPDGYTLLLATSALTTSVVLHKSLPYDVGHDFAPVAMFGGAPSLLMAAPQKGYNTVADLVAAAKAGPGKIKFGSVGIGSASYIGGARFSQLAGMDVVHVGYSGPAAALDDLAAGRIDFYFVPVTPALPLIVQGKAVPLAVSTPNRLQSLPGLPTVSEVGISASGVLDLVRSCGASKYTIRDRQQAQCGHWKSARIASSPNQIVANRLRPRANEPGAIRAVHGR